MKGWPIEQKIGLLRPYPWSSYCGYAGLKEKEAFVDYGPLLAWLGEGKKDRARVYREYVESGIAGSDKELVEVMGHSTKAIGDRTFCQWVEEEQQQKLGQFQAPEEIRLRRTELGIDSSAIVKAVSQACKVEAEELKRLHSRHPGRRRAMKLLVEMGGLSEREVARQLGLGSSAAVSRHLKGLANEVQADPALGRLLEKARKLIRSGQLQGSPNSNN